MIVKALPLAPAAVAFWRLAIAAAVVAAVAAVLRLPWPRSPGVVIGAGVAFGLHQLLYITATKATSIAIVTLIGALQPLLVALVSRRTVGESVPAALQWCALLAVAGVAIVVQANLGDQSRSLFGDVLAVVNVVAFTTYFLCAKRARDLGASTLTFTAAAFGVALVVVAPALALTAGGVGGAALLPTGWQFAVLGFLALVPGGGHLLLNWAHPKVSAALSSLVLACLPLLSSVWARLIFGEPFGWRHIAGMLLAIAAVEGGRRAERRRAAAGEPLPAAT